MNERKKTVLIAAVCLIAVGLLVGVIGLAVNHFRFDGLSLRDRGGFVTVETLRTETYPVDAAFRSIEVRGGSADVELLLAADGHCRVECSECEGRTHTVEVRGDTLYVERVTEKNLSLTLTGTERDVIALWLPETDYASLTVGVSSGDVQIPAGFRFAAAAVSSSSGNVDFRAQVEGMLTAAASSGSISVTDTAAQSLAVSASSGDLFLSSVQTGEVSLSASSGSIRLEQVRVDGALRAETTSGEITSENVTCGTLETESSSGDQRLTDTEADGTFSVTTTSGDVGLAHCDGGSIALQSSSGEVSGSLRTEKIVYAESSSGSIRVPHGQTGGLCEIRTASGDIRITFDT